VDKKLNYLHKQEISCDQRIKQQKRWIEENDKRTDDSLIDIRMVLHEIARGMENPSERLFELLDGISEKERMTRDE
jgi:hypothetical protein